MGFIYIYGWLTLARQDSWQQKASLPSPIFWAQLQPDLLNQGGRGKQQLQVMKIFLGGGEVWMSECVWGVWCVCHERYIQLYSRQVFLHKKAVSRLTDK